MSLAQLSINVSDFDAAVASYSRLFGPAPAKLRPGYADFALDAAVEAGAELAGQRPGGTINRLGVGVGSTEDVTHAEARLAAAGLPVEPEPATVCLPVE